MIETIIKMVFARLNRIYQPGEGDEDDFTAYIRARISAAMEELRGMGIEITSSPDDIMLVTDYVCWQYANREKAEDDPDWLRRRLKNRWIREVGQRDS